MTPLMEAVFWDKVDIVELLLSSNPDMQPKDTQGKKNYIKYNPIYLFESYINLVLTHNLFLCFKVETFTNLLWNDVRKKVSKPCGRIEPGKKKSN